MTRKKTPSAIVLPLAVASLVLGQMLAPGCSQEPNDSSPAAVNYAEVKLYNAEIERVVAIGRVEPERKIITLFPETGGRLLSVQVRMGDSVRRGDILYEIDHEREDAGIARTQAQIREQESALPQIGANLAKARLQAANAERSYQRVLTVFEGGAETRQSLDDAESAWRTAVEDVAALEAQLANARASLEVLRADLRLAALDREDRFVRAPVDGVLFSVDVAPGFRVDTGTQLGKLAPLSPMTVLTEIDELFADRVELGQPAFIRRQGAVDTIASGIVIEVAPALSQKSLFADAVGALEDRRVREVRIRIEAGVENLLYGARVECVVRVGKNN